MKTNKEQAAQNRERILDVAAQLFRERGFDGIGVADLMRSAGLTHGGFYGHFASKDDLIAQSSTRTLQKSLEKWRRIDGEGPQGRLAAIIHSYLSPRHRDHPGHGCALTALGGDMARQSPAMRQGVTQGLQALVDELLPLVDGNSAQEKQQGAWAIMAGMVGGIVLARLVDDPALAQTILQHVEQALVPDGRHQTGLAPELPASRKPV